MRGSLLPDPPMPASCLKRQIITGQCKPLLGESQMARGLPHVPRHRAYDRLPNASAALIPPNPKELETARRAPRQSPSPVT